LYDNFIFDFFPLVDDNSGLLLLRFSDTVVVDDNELVYTSNILLILSLSIGRKCESFIFFGGIIKMIFGTRLVKQTFTCVSSVSNENFQ